MKFKGKYRIIIVIFSCVLICGACILGCCNSNDPLVGFANTISNIKTFVNDGATLEYQADEIDQSFTRVNNRASATNLNDEQFANFRKVLETDSINRPIYRSASPFKGDERSAYVDSCAKNVGIKTIIYINGLQDRYSSPMGYCSEQKIVPFTIKKPFDDADNKQQVALIMKQILNSEGPILICDDEGLFATGCISSILQYLAGYTDDYASVDWALSYLNLTNSLISEHDYAAITSQLSQARANLSQCVKSQELSKALTACRANMASALGVQPRQMKYMNMKRLAADYLRSAGMDNSTIDSLSKMITSKNG